MFSRWTDKLAGPFGAKKRIAKVSRTQPVEPPSEGAQDAAGLAAEPRIVFILSTERSGSTLLSVSMGAHPRHIVPPEMHLMSYPTFDAWRDDYPAAMESLDYLLRACGDEASTDEVEKRFAGWSPEKIYRWVVDERMPGESLFVDKTPKYSRDLDVMNRIEGLRPHYIWLVRHPLGVAASQLSLRRNRRLRRAGGGLARVKRPFIDLREKLGERRMILDEVEYWKDCNANIQAFLSSVDRRRQMKVVFERFVTTPEPVLKEVCGWLGTPFDAAMLDPTNHVPSGMNELLGDPKLSSNQHQKIDPAVADSWRGKYDESMLDAETLGVIEALGVPVKR